jgi:hypothetical protein
MKTIDYYGRTLIDYTHPLSDALLLLQKNTFREKGQSGAIFRKKTLRPRGKLDLRSGC